MGLKGFEPLQTDPKSGMLSITPQAQSSRAINGTRTRNTQDHNLVLYRLNYDRQVVHPGAYRTIENLETRPSAGFPDSLSGGNVTASEKTFNCLGEDSDQSSAN